MFSITADIIRLGIGILLFSVDMWLMELAGAALILCAIANFAMHAFVPGSAATAQRQYDIKTRNFDHAGNLVIEDQSHVVH